MKNLYIDFDGVILDTISNSYELLEKANIPIVDSEEVRSFYANMDWRVLLEKSLPINDSLECIQKIIDSKRFDVSILTHVNSLQEVIEKVTYIRKFFKDITVIPVPKAISKTKMVQTEGSVLIDDYDENLREWLTEDGISIKFSQTLDSNEFLVLDRLDKVLEMDI